MVLPPDPAEPVLISIEGPADLMVRQAEVEKSFALGATVSIVVFEIRDMLWTFSIATMELRSVLVEHIKRLGLPITGKPPPSEITE